MNTKKDYFLVWIIGIFVGVLALIPLKNIGIEFGWLFAVVLVIGLSVFAIFALFILKLLSRWIPVFEKFGKFAAVGTLNTLLDLGVLNLLIFIVGISSGVGFVLFKAVSFLAGTTNSYLWNKLWTFQSKAPVSAGEYVRFAGFTLVGTLINISVAASIVNGISAPNGINEKLWANIGALIAVAVSFLWNFLTYKNVVFKKSNSNDPNYANNTDGN